MQTLTEAQAAAAFEAWERDFRANPAEFLTADEAARMEVAPLSEQRAIHFMALLRQGGADAGDSNPAKLCTSCRHHKQDKTGKCFEHCLHPSLGINLVNGAPNQSLCQSMRDSRLVGLCGPLGKLFEAVSDAGKTIADSGTQICQGV